MWADTAPRHNRRTVNDLRYHKRVRTALAVLVLVIVGALVPAILFTSAGPDAPGAKAAAVALVVIQATTLLWMPKRPEAAMSVAIATGVGIEQLCPTARHLRRREHRPERILVAAPAAHLAVGAGRMVALAPLRLASGGGATAVLTAIGASVLAWTWGELMRVRRARRADAAQRAVAEERARIARELHDVVAHNVSLIVVQAVAAEDVFDARPDVARDALRTIEASGRAALAELRRLLGRRARTSADDAIAPQPGLSRSTPSPRPSRRRGSRSTSTARARPSPCPPGVDLSAYRIVQEALTNTLRHAARDAAPTSPSATARTRSRSRSSTTVAARRPTPDAGGGHGIVGMRERAALVGGTIEIGAAPGGGFRVRAELPLGTRA